MTASQDQIDTRAIAIAAASAQKSDMTYSMLSDHIKSCEKTQRTNMLLIIATLVSALGTLATLYVLPHGITTVTTQTTLQAPAAPAR